MSLLGNGFMRSICREGIHRKNDYDNDDENTLERG